MTKQPASPGTAWRAEMVTGGLAVAQCSWLKTPMFFLFLTGAIGWMATNLLLSPEPVLAGQGTTVKAMGTMPKLIEVTAPESAINSSSAQSNDGKAMLVEVQDPVTIQSNVPVQVILSALVLDPPAGVPAAAVAGQISLIQGVSEWLSTDTNQGSSLYVDEPLASFEAKVRFHFYSTTAAPLRPGVYTGTTVLTSIDN